MKDESGFIKGFALGVFGALLGFAAVCALTGCANEYTAPNGPPPCAESAFFGIVHNTCESTPWRLPDEHIACGHVDLGGVVASYVYVRSAGVMTTTVELLPGSVPSVYDGQDWFRRWIGNDNTVQCVGFDRGECVGDITVLVSHDCGTRCVNPTPDAMSTLTFHAELGAEDLPVFTLYDSDKLWAAPQNVSATVEDCMEATL